MLLCWFLVHPLGVTNLMKIQCYDTSIAISSLFVLTTEIHSSFSITEAGKKERSKLVEMTGDTNRCSTPFVMCVKRFRPIKAQLDPLFSYFEKMHSDHTSFFWSVKRNQTCNNVLTVTVFLRRKCKCLFSNVLFRHFFKGLNQVLLTVLFKFYCPTVMHSNSTLFLSLLKCAFLLLKYF